MPPRLVVFAPPSAKPGGGKELLKATIDAAVRSKALRASEFERVIVDTTVQEKAITHPVDSRLLEIARAKVVQAARRVGISLKQTFARERSESALNKSARPFPP